MGEMVEAKRSPEQTALLDFDGLKTQVLAAKELSRKEPLVDIPPKVRIFYTQDWQEVLPNFLPYTKNGELNPLVFYHSTNRRNPLYFSTVLRTGFENVQIPFGVDVKGEAGKIGVDVTVEESVGYAIDLWELFGELTRRVDPERVKEILGYLSEFEEVKGTVHAHGRKQPKEVDDLTGYADHFMGRIFFDSGGKPRFKIPDKDEVLKEVRDDEDKQVAYWFALKAYFTVLVNKFYNGGVFMCLPEDSKIKSDARFSDYITKYLLEDGYPQEKLPEGVRFYSELLGNPLFKGNSSGFRFAEDRDDDEAISSIRIASGNFDILYRAEDKEAREKFLRRDAFKEVTGQVEEAIVEIEEIKPLIEKIEEFVLTKRTRYAPRKVRGVKINPVNEVREAGEVVRARLKELEDVGFYEKGEEEINEYLEELREDYDYYSYLMIDLWQEVSGKFGMSWTDEQEEKVKDLGRIQEKLRPVSKRGDWYDERRKKWLKEEIKSKSS